MKNKLQNFVKALITAGSTAAKLDRIKITNTKIIPILNIIFRD